MLPGLPRHSMYEPEEQTVPRGLLKKSFQAAAGFGRAARISMIEQSNSIIAAASFLRFMVMAVRRAQIVSQGLV